MNIKQVLLTVITVAVLSEGCKKDDKEVAPQVELSITGDAIAGTLNKEIVIAAASVNGKSFSHEWKVNGAVVAGTYQLSFTPKIAGTYAIAYRGFNGAGEVTKSYTLTVPVPVIPISATSSKYISKVFDYLPAPGQFINVAGLGTTEQAQKLVGGINSLLSLGAYGGYVVFGFDHSVVNKEGSDLAIYGNPIGVPSEWAEPGIVMVSQDANGNGLADDLWYELAGSVYNEAGTVKNYKITYYNPKKYASVPWKDNQGKTGAVEINQFRRQQYYPAFAANQDSISFTGTLLPSTFGKAGSLTVNKSFSFGYTDSWSLGDDFATNRYNSLDISWAVDGTGKKVELKTIDFVKVFTGQNEKGTTLLGEISTEIRGAEDLSIK
jgi:hypothetical protein